MKASWKRITSIIVLISFLFGMMGEIAPAQLFANEVEETPAADENVDNLTVEHILQEFPEVSRAFVEEQLSQGRTLLAIFSALSLAREEQMGYEEAYNLLYPTEINSSQNVTSDVYSQLSSLFSAPGVTDDAYGSVVTAPGGFVELGENELPTTVFGNVYGQETAPEQPTPSVGDDVYVEQRMETFFAGGSTPTKPDILEEAPVYDANKINQAPFSISNQGESISTMSGGLSLQSTDMTLPGRGGMGFALTRQYQSDDAQFYDIGVVDNSYNQSVYRYWVVFNVVKRQIQRKYEASYYEERWQQYDTNGDGVVDFSTGRNTKTVSVGPFNTVDEARYAVERTKKYTIPPDSRTETASRTDRNKSFPQTVSYSKGGYVGTLYRDGASYVSSGSYVPTLSKRVTLTCVNKLKGQYDQKGVWHKISDTPCPDSKTYDSGGYKGTLGRGKAVMGRSCPSPDLTKKGYICTKDYEVSYTGIVTKPGSDSRVWKQDYKGTVTKPGETSRIGYSSWRNTGLGRVRDAYQTVGINDIKAVFVEGPAEKQKISIDYDFGLSYDDYDIAKRRAEAINDFGGNYLTTTDGYNYYYASKPDAYVYVETIGSYKVRIYNNILTQPVHEKLYPLGKGWSWKLPYVETVLKDKYIHLQEGGKYKIEGGKLKGYDWEGLTFSPDNSVQVNGEQSANVLSSVEGTWKQYFSGDGRILLMADNRNNRIEFSYTDINGNKQLTAIKDAVGNTIQIAYTPTEVILTKGKERIVYHKRREQNMELLEGVTDAKGLKTTYNYSLVDAKMNLVSYDPARAKLNPYALLTKAQYPTGAATLYTYEDSPVQRYTGKKSYNESYRLKSRKDEVTYANGFSKTFNPQMLFYNGDMGSSYGSNIQFSVAIDNGLQVQTYSYNKNYLDEKTSEQYYLASSVTEADGQKRTTSMSYDKKVANRAYPVAQATATKQTNSLNADTLVTTTSYNDYGNVTQSTGPNGASVVNTYDDRQLLKTVRTSANASSQLFAELARNSYGDITQMLLRQDGPGGQILQRVDYTGIDAYGNITNQVIHNDGKQIQTITEYGNEYAAAYPTAQSVTVTDADGRKSTVQQRMEYDLPTGLATAFTDGNNKRTAYRYDVLGRITEVAYADGTSVQVAYDDVRNSVTTTNELGIRSRMTWNALGWETESGVFTAAGFRAQSTTDYDRYGRVSWKADALGNTTNDYYDSWSRTIQTSLPDGSQVRMQYNDAARTVTTYDGEFNRVTQSYDLLGQLVKVEESSAAEGTSRQVQHNSYDAISGKLLKNLDGNLQPTAYTYDVLGRLTAVTNAKNETTRYTYDSLGNLTTTLNADGTQKTKSYDELGRVIKQMDEQSQTVRFYYDAGGNLKTRVDRNGKQTNYTYDQRNRLLTQTSPDQVVDYTYDATGKRLSMKDTTGTTAYQYDPYTQELLTVTYPDGLKLQQQYDDNGNRVQMTGPFGQSTRYAYDRMSRLTAVGTNLSSPVAEYGYALNSALTDIRYGQGLRQQNEYTGGFLSGLQVERGGQSVASYGYTRDGNDNIVEREQNGLLDMFGYDELSRINSASPGNETYGYDLRGNRQTLTTEQEPRVSTGEYTYDAQNRLSQVQKNGTTVQYRYNGDGLLTGRIESGVETRYYYDEDQIIAEATVEQGTPKLKASYIRGNRLEAIRYADGREAYPVYNGHGDIVQLQDAAGVVLAEYTYDIWGNPLEDSGNASAVHNPFRYSGELWDDAVDLQYLRARWYDPSVGRFLNEDTFEGELDNPLTLNLYTYVINNPLKYVDSTGNRHEAGAGWGGFAGDKNVSLEPWKGWSGPAGSTINFLLLDDVNTLRDPNAANYEKTLAGLGFIPMGKVVGKGYKVLKYASKEGRVIFIRISDDVAEKINKLRKKKVPSCNCFAAGTKVQTDEGEKNIEDIEVGDQVLAKDESDPEGDLGYKEVTALYRNQRDDIIKLHVGEQVIETTDNHPFWVEGKGWIFADELQVGDKLQKADGSNLKIDKVEFLKLDKPITVYNFTVADFHTYYVTDIGIWVHNTDCLDLSIKPTVSNSKLKNIVKDLYKGQNMPNLIGNGTTMDAIRYELRTGQAVGGKFHNQKGQDYSRGLQKLINGGNLSAQDKTIAQAIYNDLQKALAGN